MILLTSLEASHSAWMDAIPGHNIAETATATLIENSIVPLDPFVDDANSARPEDRITISPGATLPTKSGLLEYIVGINNYTITVEGGDELTQAELGGGELPIRILDVSGDRLVLIDFDDTMIATLNSLPPITKISFASGATQNSNYTEYLASGFNAAYDPQCFVSGTLIETDHGLKAVENLRCGDAVRTLDNSFQEIKWIGESKLNSSELERNPKLFPICIKAGALGEDMQAQDLFVSRQHRILVRSNIAQRMFDTTEIFVPAIKLVEVEGVSIATDFKNVTYWHILFDKHEVIFSNGAPTESLFLGKETLNNISDAAREEIEILFPQVSEPGFVLEHARFVPPKGKQIKQLVARHIKNGQPII